MTKKIFTIIAALGVIAMSAIGCQSVTDDNNGTEGSNDKTDNNILAAPVVELPANVGVNPFKGKTFEKREDYRNRTRYIFSSDGKTITVEHSYDNKEFVPSVQYKYSVDTNKKELSWHMKKVDYGGDGQMRSFEELVAYIKSGKYLEDREDQLKELLDKGKITEDEFDEYLKNQKEGIDKEIASGFHDIKNIFAKINRYKYEYNEDKGTLDLYEQFEKSSASFEYKPDNWETSNELFLTSASIYLSDNAYIDLEKDNHNISFNFKSQFFVSNGIIIFVNGDDKNDTFTAKYNFIGSGNDTKMQLSFTYDGKEFNPTLDFDPDEIHLTEVK